MNSPDDKLPNDNLIDDKLPDDNLIDRLGRLGAAAERSVAETTAESVMRGTVVVEAPIIELDRPRRGRLALAAAAALVAIAGLGAVFFAGARGEEPAAELATQESEDDARLSAAQVDDNGWEELRQCESSGRYDIDTGNLFYGAYQFTQESWETVGGTGNPASAPAHEQDLRAAELYARRGASPWPVCGRFLTGPMRNPLLAAWAAPWDQATGVIVFFDPEITDDTLRSTRAAIEGLGLFDDAQTRFVTKAEAFEEFGRLFGPGDPAIEATTEADMPPSLRLAMVRRPTTSSPNDPQRDPVAEIRALPGVFTAVAGPAGLPPTSVTVPSLGITTEVPDSWTIAGLASAVVVVAPTGLPAFPIELHSVSEALGFGAGLPRNGPLILASTRSDWDLRRLEAGDRIVVETAVDVGTATRVAATTSVVVAEAAQAMHVDELSNAAQLELGPIVLIAVDPADPFQRLVVGTQAPPE